MGREKGDTGKSLGTSVGGGLTTHGSCDADVGHNDLKNNGLTQGSCLRSNFDFNQGALFWPARSPIARSALCPLDPLSRIG